MGGNSSSVLAQSEPVKPELKHLMHYLMPISNRWFDIGRALGLPSSELHSLNETSSLANNRPYQKLRQVLKLWLHSSPSVSWDTVIAAISGPIVNDRGLAGKIEWYLIERDHSIEAIYDVTPDKHDLKYILRGMKSDRELWEELGVQMSAELSVEPSENIADIDALIDYIYSKEVYTVTWGGVMDVLGNLMPLVSQKKVDLVEVVKEFLSKKETLAKYRACVPVYSKVLNRAIAEQGYKKVRFSKITFSGPPRSGRASIANFICHSDALARLQSSLKTVNMKKSFDEEHKGCSIDKNEVQNQECSVQTEDASAEISVGSPIDSSPTSVLFSGQEGTDSVLTKKVAPRKYSCTFPDISTAAVAAIRWRSSASKQQSPIPDHDFHLVHVINSGGQATFLDIAPALLRYTPVNILTCMLKDNLDETPKFYYTIEGKDIAQPEEHQLTHLQVLESSLRSLASVDPRHPSGIHAKFSDKKPHFLVIGTYYDQIGKSTESLDEKNAILWSTFGHYCDSELIINYDETNEKIIFPLNTTAESEEDIKVVERIVHITTRYYIEAEIPSKWFEFKLRLDEYEKKKGTSIISKSKCFELGLEYEMKQVEVVSALMFFHDLTIYSYFSNVLPEVVFLHPQPLLEKLSEVISISFPESVTHLQKCGFTIPAGAHMNMKTKGIFKRNLLTNCLDKGFTPEFTADDFLLLMVSLFIIAPLPEKDHYFLPSALPTTALTDEEREPFMKNVEPLIMTWDMKPIPKGLFPALVINLLHSPEPLKFELLQPSVASWLQYRNAIRLTCKNIGGRLLLVDSTRWLEIYYDGPVEECSRIRSIVLDSIAKVVDNFHYVSTIKTPEECFRCPKQLGDRCNVHLCSLNERKTTLTCQDHGVITASTSDLSIEKCRPWFIAEVSNINQEPDHSVLINILAGIASLWHEIGLALSISSDHLNGLVRSRETEVVKMDMVLRKWWDCPKKTHPYTWKTIIDAVRGPIVEKVLVAEEIRRHVMKLSVIETKPSV